MIEVNKDFTADAEHIILSDNEWEAVEKDLAFKEIQVKPERIRFKKNGNITISTPLIRKYWNSENCTRVQIFQDADKKILGFKPSKNEGYKLYTSGGCWRITGRTLGRVIGTRDFKPEWNSKLGMLIIGYGEKGSN